MLDQKVVAKTLRW